MEGINSIVFILMIVVAMVYSHSTVDIQIEVATQRDHNKTSIDIHTVAPSYSPSQYNTNELIALTKGTVASRTDWLWRQADKWTEKITKFFAEFDLRSFLGLKGSSKVGFLSIQAMIIEGHKLQFSITNNHRKPLCVQKIGLLLDNKLWPTGVRVWQGDRQLPQVSFHVPLLLRKIREKNFMLLDSGETITVTRDLTDYYKLVPKTQYIVEIISFLNYFKKNSENSCKVGKLSIENSRVHKWRSPSFQLNPKFTPVWKKRVSLSGWLKDNQKTITQASKQLYIVSRRKINKKGISYLLQVRKLVLESVKGAVNILRKINNDDTKRYQLIYKRWFGDIDKEKSLKIIETYNKIIQSLTKDPLIYTLCVPCQVYSPIFAIPFHTMNNKGIPLLNLCSKTSYFTATPINSAVFDTIRGLVHLFADTSHTYKPLLDKGSSLRYRVTPIIEKSQDRAFKSSENIAIFAIESVSEPFVSEKVMKKVVSPQKSRREGTDEKKGKKSLRNVFKKLKQKFIRGH